MSTKPGQLHCVVRAHLVQKTYKTGVKVTDAQMRELRITPNSVMPKWNYTIEPI